MTDYILVTEHGIGDTYIIASLVQAFKEQHCKNGEKVFIVAQQAHYSLIALFPDIDGIFGPDDIPSGNIIYPHPSKTSVRADHCNAISSLNDVSMYALILGLNPNTVKLSLPIIPNSAKTQALKIACDLKINIGHTVLVEPESRSWPSISTPFWTALKQKLRDTGWDVIDNDPTIPLDVILSLAELAGWVIGANCGFMQMMVQAQTKCRKTILTKNIAPIEYPLPITSAWEYRQFTKIDGNKYDIEEFTVDEEENSFNTVINLVVNSRNALGPAPIVEPLSFVKIDMSPGEFLDRLSILLVKQEKLPHKVHLLWQDLVIMSEQRKNLVSKFPQIIPLETELKRLNEIAWDNNEILIDMYKDGECIFLDSELDVIAIAFGSAHRANQQRVRIKNQINELCGAGVREEKSYD